LFSVLSKGGPARGTGGAPSEGYSDQEVLKRYGEVSHAVPPDQYAQAAQEARIGIEREQWFVALHPPGNRPRSRRPFIWPLLGQGQ